LLRLPAGVDAKELGTGRPARVRSWLLDKALGQ